jgi:hypothetical protein
VSSKASIRFCVCLALILSSVAVAQVPLSADSYRELGATQGTVLLQVNWGRYLKCGGYQNAQLQKLAFRRLDPNAAGTPAKDWILAPKSTLMTQPVFQSYEVLLAPGEYALSGFRFKVASSVSSIKVAEPDASELIVDGKPTVGSFTVAAGEVVYIGHFGVDCTGEPSPWRFYVDGKQAFTAFVNGFHQEFPFVNGVPVVYRLFVTDKMGQPYELKD